MRTGFESASEPAIIQSGAPITKPQPPEAELKDRSFSFYPPIIGFDHNEWSLKEATWSDMLVKNSKSGQEIGIPRRFFGAVSEVDKPVVIVGLTAELEYKTGAVWPVRRTVYDMPAPPMTRPPGADHQRRPNEPTGLAAMIGLSSEGTETRISKMIAWTFLAVAATSLLILALVKFTPETKPTFIAKDQGYLELNRDDDYFAITRKLGRPSDDHWKPGEGEIHYRALFYNERGYAVVLMGTNREDVRYIGTMGLGKDGKAWAPLHYVEFARGGSTASLLRTLRRF